ncbi:MAG: hypothetical protein KatS3mg121_1197 [Gammaproteobacteria bacterium]|nr:MAG: hypothetical protein KatS3mg121_1197 [Gammaproteobacteria bacterium]
MSAARAWGRIWRLAAALLLAVAAALQWNDPDPWLWFAVYGGAAVVVGTAAWRRVPVALWAAALALALLTLTLAGGGFLAWLALEPRPSLWAGMRADRPEIEAAREWLGSALVVALLLAARPWRRPPV